MEITELDRLYAVWLTQIPGIGPVGQHRLLRSGMRSKEIFECVRDDAREVQKKLPAAYLPLLTKHTNLEPAQRIVEECRKYDIEILTLEEKLLPSVFSMFEDLPVLLYAKGNCSILNRGFGVIGSRRCTTDGKSRAILAAGDAASRGECVISGMAKGIDSYAHTAAMKTGGITAAVLGNGLDICYPQEHRSLMEAIQGQGITVSEYPPGTKPMQYNFPKRNRIIAALSHTLFVAEAGKNSGTQSTIAAAEKYERKVIYAEHNG